MRGMLTDKALRYAIVTGLFAVLFVPFIVANPLFFPFITGKNFAFRIIIEVVFGLWVILALRDPAVRLTRSTLLIAIVAFIASIGISALLGENPSKSFWSNFERMEGWIAYLHLGAYFIVLSSVFAGEKIWRTFWNASIGVSVLLSLYGVLQLAGVLTINQGGVRVDATFGNATYLAVYMLFHFFLTLLALAKWSPGRLAQVGYAIALVLQGLMIFYAATRGTILGLVGGLFLAGLIFIVFGKGDRRLRQWGAGLAIAIALVAGGFFLIRDSALVRENDVLTRLASISLSEGQTRFTIWGMAARGFLERPVFGWGQEGFNYVFNEHFDPSLYGQEPWFDRAHNEFIDWLVAGGAAGFFLYVSLYVIALWYLWRGSAFDIRERAVMTGLLMGYAFHNLFVFDNLMSSVMFFSILAYLASRSSAPRLGTTALSQAATRVWAVGIAIAMLAILYFANVPGIVRASRLIEALKPHCADTAGIPAPCTTPGVHADLAQNFAYFKKAAEGGGIGRQEAHEQLLQFAIQIRSQNLADVSTPEFRDEVVRYTKEKFLEEVARAPEDARLRIFFASFLRETGDLAGAREHAEKARELSPGKQTTLFELGTLAVAEGDSAGAVGYFREAFELDTRYDQARIAYASILIRAGAGERAKAILAERWGAEVPDHTALLQAYFDAGDFVSAVAVAEARAAKDPTNPQRRTELAATYLGAGRRADAIAALREAIRLNPDFKAQGEYFISEIEAGRNP